MQLGKEQVAVACMTLVITLGEQSFAGSALVRQNEKDSIVRLRWTPLTDAWAS